jgi:hypothetical protein
VFALSGRYWDWPAGYVLGARYLTPVLPFLALPCAFALRRTPRLGGTLAIYSILIISIATLTDACPDYGYFNPLIELQIPMLMRGQFSNLLGDVIGLPRIVSVAIFFVVMAWGIRKINRQALSLRRSLG